MSVARITEIQSSSTKSFEDAVQKGIARADKTLAGGRPRPRAWPVRMRSGSSSPG
jgi:hypothetical protein